MIKKIKHILTNLAISGALFLPLAVPALAHAQVNTTQLCCGSSLDVNCASAAGCDSSAGTDINSIITKVLDIISIVVGITAVIMIIIGGLKYILSGGESGRVSGAKDTILFAIVGLVVVALAQVIVHFVLNNLSNTQ